MTTLFVHHGGPRLQTLLCRPLYRELLARLVAIDVDRLVIGCCRNEAAWFEALTSETCSVAISELDNTAIGPLASLDYLAPKGAIIAEVALSDEDGRTAVQWEEVVESLAASLAGLGIALPELVDPDAVPLPNLSEVSAAAGEALDLGDRPAVYLDNARSAWLPGQGQPHGWFAYDVARIADVLADHWILTTAPTDVARANVRTLQGWSWPGLAHISERCELLVGSSFDPFALTYTEANRFKPRALCGYDPRSTPPPWDYPGHPLEILPTMDELVDFLIANAGACASAHATGAER